MKLYLTTGDIRDVETFDFGADGIIIDECELVPYSHIVRVCDDPEPEVHPILRHGMLGFFRMEELDAVLCNFGARMVVKMVASSPRFRLTDEYFTYVPWDNALVSLSAVPEDQDELETFLSAYTHARNFIGKED